jgi:phage tail sheath gpL-like
MAGMPRLNLRALLVGVMTEDGNAEPDVPKVIGQQIQADIAFGQGSELARMVRAFFGNNFANEMWCLPLAEPPGGTAASGVIRVLAPPTEAGTIHLYIGGQKVAVNIGGTDAVEDIAEAIVARIMATDDLPVTAEVNATDLNHVDLTCVFKGVSGNEIRVEFNYFGTIGGEQPIPGLEIEFQGTPHTTAKPDFLSGGVGTPDMKNAIIAMGEEEFEYVALPYTDSTTLMDWEMEYGFWDEGRWGWKRQLFGHVFGARRGTYSDLIQFGRSRNSGVVSIMAFELTTPTPMFEMTAAYVAKAQRALVNDPARPLQTLQLFKTLPAKLHERFNWLELNSIASNGLAIQKVWQGSGYPQIAREQTTYQWGSYGIGDDAYELVTTLATLAKLLRNQRHQITQKFPRHKLANDGTRFGPGQAIVTPGIIKAELVAQYALDEYNGLVEDARNFKRFLMVERDSNNPNRVNVLYPPDLINQLRIFAVLAQFRLQYDRGVDVEIIGRGTQGIAGAGGARAY